MPICGIVRETDILTKSDRKRILFLAPSMRGGGSERVLTILIRHIDRNRFLPILGLLRKEGPFVSKLPEDVEVRDLLAKRTRYSFWKIIKLIRETQPDLVFSTLGHLNIAVMLVKCAIPSGIRFIARESNIPSINLKESPFPHILPFLYRRFYPEFEKVICQSSEMREDLVKHFGLSWDKVVLVHNPVDTEAIQLYAKDGRCLLSKNGYNILAAGKLMYQKGFDLLLRSIPKVGNDNVHLTILGDGPEENHLKALCDELGLNDVVTFAGFVDNPYRYMAQADLFVLSSRFEGFPNVVLEAMACGTPVVAFECPGDIGVIIEDGVNGWKVEAENISALGDTIEEALKTDWDRELIREGVERKFGVKRIVAEYEEVFLRVLGEGGDQRSEVRGQRTAGQQRKG